MEIQNKTAAIPNATITSTSKPSTSSIFSKKNESNCDDDATISDDSTVEAMIDNTDSRYCGKCIMLEGDDQQYFEKKEDCMVLLVLHVILF
jgi:hypothetical protein